MYLYCFHTMPWSVTMEQDHPSHSCSTHTTSWTWSIVFRLVLWTKCYVNLRTCMHTHSHQEVGLILVVFVSSCCLFLCLQSIQLSLLFCALEMVALFLPAGPCTMSLGQGNPCNTHKLVCPWPHTQSCSEISCLGHACWCCSGLL